MEILHKQVNSQKVNSSRGKKKTAGSIGGWMLMKRTIIMKTGSEASKILAKER